MRLIRLTLVFHMLSHAALWVAALFLLLTPDAASGSVAHFHVVISGGLIIHLGSYHWAMAQWQEDLCEGRRWPASLYTGVLVLSLGLLALLVPALALYCVLAAVFLLVWQESWGAIAQYIQPWYLRLRWLQMISLTATQILLLVV